MLLTSVDEDEKGSQGNTGKRRNWNLMFKSLKKNESLIVSIRNGKFNKLGSYPTTDDLPPINYASVKVDSSVEIVTLAMDKYNLKLGSDYIHGMHFSLEKSDNYVFLTITGNDEEGSLKKVHFDASNGKYLGMTENKQKIEKETGK